MLQESYEKHPDQDRSVSWDFTLDLTDGESVSSAVVTCKNYKTEADAGSMLATASVASNVVSIKISDGDNGVDYEMQFTATTSTGETLVKTLMLRVRE